VDHDALDDEGVLACRVEVVDRLRGRLGFYLNDGASAFDANQFITGLEVLHLEPAAGCEDLVVGGGAQWLAVGQDNALNAALKGLSPRSGELT
jgi:hypothetical protein